MKRIIVLLLTLSLATSVFQPHAAANDICAAYKGMTKVYWDGVELKKGQIGRLFIMKDTPLFSLKGDKQVFSRMLKANENYRIYSFKPGMLDVGGGYYVTRDSKIRYETPSKSKLQAKACVYGTSTTPATPTPTPTPELTEVDMLTQEVNGLEAALKNNETQLQIEERSKRIQTKLDALKYKQPKLIEPIVNRLKVLTQGYKVLAQRDFPFDLHIVDMEIDERKGYLYVSTMFDDKLYIFSTEDLSLVKELPVNNTTNIQMYKGKLYIGAESMVVFDPATMSAMAIDPQLTDIKTFTIHEDHIYYVSGGGKSKIQDYDMNLKTTKPITDENNPKDYEFDLHVKLSVDPASDILFVSNNHLKAIDLKTKKIIARDLNTGFWPAQSASNIWDNGELFVDGYKIASSDLGKITGKYVGGHDPVSIVKGKYVFGGMFIYDRENFVPLRSMPTYSYEAITVDSSMNVYALNTEEETFRKIKMNILPIHLPSFKQAEKQLVFEKEVTDWEYDPKTNKILAISMDTNKLFYINADTLMVEKEVFIGSRPWDLVVYGDSIYVALSEAHLIAVAGTNQASPISYVTVNARPTDMEVGKNYIYYRSSEYRLNAYDKRDGSIVEVTNGTGWFYSPKLKLDPSGEVLYIDNNAGSQIHAIDAETFQPIKQSDFHAFSGDNKIFLDGPNFYHGKFRSPNADLKNVEKITDTPIVYVGKDYLITNDGYYDKASLIKQKVFTNRIHSAQMNTNTEEVYVLNEQKNTLTKYNHVKDVK
ncbi:YncE family protein [Paenisporosarcina sp. NPDC076898]|uniref:YncE family protein n=1 Tax=unclassified Paenisporosarcina TaxID=2642018 RepID=UPI003D00B5B1